MCHPFACSTPSRATPLTTRALQRVVDAERWRVERLEREQHDLSEREQMDLGASTESMPSSAAFEDSAISSEGEEDEESEVEDEGEEGEGGEGGEGGEDEADEAETEGCDEDEPPLMRTSHTRASLEEFTLLERACCEERADSEAVQGSRALSGRDGGGDALVHARAAPLPVGTSPTLPSMVAGKTEGAKPAPPSEPLPPATAAVHGASRAAAASARGAGIRGTSPVMPTVLDFGGATAMRPSAGHDVGAARRERWVIHKQRALGVLAAIVCRHVVYIK